ncbi:MAG: type II toxin-antitoxin system HicB family antitoxin [Candidatus Vogelbacteria bacterium]|nr:type II toxin-antitoxin system HicB family antitoxin [Candidatus Vogelbacteria bacterium]
MKKIISRSYSYSVVYVDSDGRYTAFVPALPGCHTQGDTYEEAEANIKEAIELYLESLAAEKTEIPEENGSLFGKVQVSFAY